MSARDAIAAWQAGRKYWRAGCNVKSDGDTLYSYGYHWPLARRVGGEVMLCTRRRSVSTRSHAAKVRRACPGCILIDWLDARPDENIARMRAEIEAEKGRLSRARKHFGAGYLDFLEANLRRYVNLISRLPTVG